MLAFSIQKSVSQLSTPICHPLNIEKLEPKIETAHVVIFAQMSAKFIGEPITFVSHDAPMARGSFWVTACQTVDPSSYAFIISISVLVNV